MGIKVLMLVTEAYGGQGGIALYNRDMIDALSYIDCVDEVTVVPRLIPLAVREIPNNVTFITKSAGSKLNYLRAIFSLFKLKKTYDIVICGHINMLAISLLMAWRSRAKHVLGIYGIDAWAATKKPLINVLARKVKHVYSISALTRKRFLTWAGRSKKQTYLLPNAIHTEWYGMSEKSSELVRRYKLNNKKVIMTLGRLSAQERYKGVDEILDIMPELLQLSPNLHYMIVGDGDDRVRLEEKSKKLGLGKYVTFSGIVDEEIKADFYRLADVYAMPSTGEGFGFVFLEAMACGIPVIASETDGGKEALRNGDLGILVNPSDKEQLKAAILSSVNKKKEIPVGLSYFDFLAFQGRVKKMLNQVLVSSHG